MPLAVSVPSLGRICVVKIVNEIKDFCQGVEFEDLGKYRLIIGPLEYLSSTCIESIFQYVILTRQLSSAWLSILIVTHLRSIDFTAYPSAVDTSLFKTLLYRCKHLERLIIPNCKKIPNSSLCDLLAKNPSILSLDISNKLKPTVNMPVVDSLARSCRCLTVLKLSDYRLEDPKSLLVLCGKVAVPDPTPSSSSLSSSSLISARGSPHSRRIPMEGASPVNLTIDDRHGEDGNRQNIVCSGSDNEGPTMISAAELRPVKDEKMQLVAICNRENYYTGPGASCMTVGEKQADSIYTLEDTNCGESTNGIHGNSNTMSGSPMEQEAPLLMEKFSTLGILSPERSSGPRRIHLSPQRNGREMDVVSGEEEYLDMRDSVSDRPTRDDYRGIDNGAAVVMFDVENDRRHEHVEAERDWLNNDNRQEMPLTSGSNRTSGRSLRRMCRGLVVGDAEQQSYNNHGIDVPINHGIDVPINHEAEIVVDDVGGIGIDLHGAGPEREPTREEVENSRGGVGPEGQQQNNVNVQEDSDQAQNQADADGNSEVGDSDEDLYENDDPIFPLTVEDHSHEFGCLELETLWLDNVNLTDQVAAVLLQSLPHLRDINLSDTDICNPWRLLDADQSVHLRLLEDLDVKSTALSRTALELIPKFHPDLQKLSISSTTLPPHTYANIGRLTGVAELELIGGQFYPCEPAEIFEKGIAPAVCGIGKHLQCLNLTSCAYVEFEIIALNCPRIEHLDLSNTVIATTYPCVSLGDCCPSLVCLNLAYAHIEAKEAKTNNPQPVAQGKALAKMLGQPQKLQELLLCGLVIKDEVFMNVFSKNVNPLKMLNVSRCQELTIASIQHVWDKCPNIRTIDMTYCKEIHMATFQIFEKKCLLERPVFKLEGKMLWK